MNTSPGRRRRLLPHPASVIAGLALVAALSGCGLTIPTDPDGTLTSVTGGELRVGTSPDGDLV